MSVLMCFSFNINVHNCQGQEKIDQKVKETHREMCVLCDLIFGKQTLERYIF